MKESAVKNMELCLLMRKLLLKDRITFIHSYRVSEIAVSFAEYLGYSDQQLKSIHVGSLLHDIGKLRIDEAILNKKDRLTDHEYSIMQKHPIYGELILEKYILADEVIMAKHHHERWDGRGYPDRLKGEQTHVYARILALADSLEAMTGIRPYRSSLSWEEAFGEIERGRGSQFDPRLTDQFLQWMQLTNISVKEDVKEMYHNIVLAM